MNKVTSTMGGILMWGAAAVCVIAATLAAQLIGAMFIVGKYATAIALVRSFYQ